MSPSLLRALMPLGWLAAGAAAVACLGVLLGGSGLRWDPLDVRQKRLATAQYRALSASAEAATRPRALAVLPAEPTARDA